MKAVKPCWISLSVWKRWGGIFDIRGLKHEVERLTNLSLREGFWNEREQAEKLMRERSRAETTVVAFERLNSDVDGLLELIEMVGDDEEELTDLIAQIPDLESGVRELEFQRMLEPEDDQDAIVSVNSGAGGSDAQDWADMLLRMYLRWCEKKGFKITLLDKHPGEVIGISSASFLVKGPYAYGFLRAENGVHRLIRISQFSGRRDTSFAGVSVVPDLDDTINIDIKKEDLEISVMRSGGAGGQHVNRTESAVRIRHIPLVSWFAPKANAVNIKIRTTHSNAFVVYSLKKNEEIENKRSKKRFKATKAKSLLAVKSERTPFNPIKWLKTNEPM